MIVGYPLARTSGASYLKINNSFFLFLQVLTEVGKVTFKNIVREVFSGIFIKKGRP
jgi:hypothetical protein